MKLVITGDFQEQVLYNFFNKDVEEPLFRRFGKNVPRYFEREFNIEQFPSPSLLRKTIIFSEFSFSHYLMFLWYRRALKNRFEEFGEKISTRKILYREDLNGRFSIFRKKVTSPQGKVSEVPWAKFNINAEMLAESLVRARLLYH
jgi:hypothetical protein